MLPKVLITIGILMYAAVVPLLEINATHVFNPEWAPHARLHEVWQLATNTAIGLYCLWLTWAKAEVRLPAILGSLVMGGFQLAFFLQGTYGGSMVLSDGSEKRVGGLNLGLISFGIAIALSVVAVKLEARHRTATQLPPRP